MLQGRAVHDMAASELARAAAFSRGLTGGRGLWGSVSASKAAAITYTAVMEHNLSLSGCLLCALCGCDYTACGCVQATISELGGNDRGWRVCTSTNSSDLVLHRKRFLTAALSYEFLFIPGYPKLSRVPDT